MWSSTLATMWPSCILDTLWSTAHLRWYTTNICIHTPQLCWRRPRCRILRSSVLGQRLLAMYLALSILPRAASFRTAVLWLRTAAGKERLSFMRLMPPTGCVAGRCWGARPSAPSAAGRLQRAEGNRQQAAQSLRLKVSSSCALLAANWLYLILTPNYASRRLIRNQAGGFEISCRTTWEFCVNNFRYFSTF